MNKDTQKRKIIRFLKGKINKDIDTFFIYQWIERCHYEGWWNLGLSLSSSVPPNSLDEHYQKRLDFLLKECRSNHASISAKKEILTQTVPETSKSEQRIRTRCKGAQFTRFIKPVVEVLKQRGGSGAVSEVIDQVIMLMNVNESEQAIKLKTGMSRVRNQIQWARFYLVKAGLIDSSRRGIWRLTQKGITIKMKEIDESAIFKEVTNIFRDPIKKKP